MKITFDRRSLISLFTFSFITLVFFYRPFTSGMNPGISVIAELAAFHICTYLCVRYDIKKAFRPQSVFFYCLELCLAASFIFFNNPQLLFLDFLALTALTSLHIDYLISEGNEFRESGIVRFLKDLFTRPFISIPSSFKEIRSMKGFYVVLISVLTAVPILLIFIALLSDADAVFSYFLFEKLGVDNIPKILSRLLFLAMITVLFSSYIYSVINRKLINSGMEIRLSFPSIGSLIPLYTVLLPLAFILMAFSVIQILYLFIGIGLPDGISVSYADYVHKGFYSLLACEILVLILISVSKLLFRDHYRSKTLKALYIILLISASIMTVSSFMRVSLYERAFGYSRLRIYVQFIDIMLLVSNLLMMISVLRSSAFSFRTHLIVLCIFLIFATYFNIDAYIAKNTVKRSSPDRHYLLELSVDAVLYYIGNYDYDTYEDLENLNRLYKNLEDSDIRFFNTGKENASGFKDIISKKIKETEAKDLYEVYIH